VNRTVLLSMTEAAALAKCADHKVGVSAIERLHSGGVRLVCMSSAGAELIRERLKDRIIVGKVVRERHRPRHCDW